MSSNGYFPLAGFGSLGLMTSVLVGIKHPSREYGIYYPHGLISLTNALKIEIYCSCHLMGRRWKLRQLMAL